MVPPLRGGVVVTERDPEEIARMACRWIATSHARWWQLVDLCKWSAARHPRWRIRRGDVWARAQERGWDVSTCRQFRFDNTLWAPLSRYAIMCSPRLALHIRPRSSPLDEVDLRAVWEAVVGDSSCLVLDDWRDAECRQASPSRAGCPA